MPPVVAHLEPDGFHCRICKDYLGRLEDAMRHLIDVHDVKNWSINVRDGIVYGGIVEKEAG